MNVNPLLSLVGDYSFLLVYAVPVLVMWAFYIGRRKLASKSNSRILESMLKAGLTEPASLHPKINRDLCIACNSCAIACPEQDVLGIVDDKVELINPTHCIGHGACAAACPVGAIELVFGSEKRGVDIPKVDATFETNVPGIYIAGELGGMGLIRNAVSQGRQAMDAIAKRRDIRTGKGYDVIIVGCGPAGFSATLSAKQHKLNYLTIDQESFGGTVSHYPRGKIVMTQPAELPLIGSVKFTETSKEALMAFWEDARNKAQISINTGEQMLSVKKHQGAFEVTTSKGVYNTATVLLAIGRRGTPRKLDVPGEDLPKVVYRLVDPEQYRDKHVLVVGGGDSALEAAISIAEQPGATVSLSYRSAAFSRAKEKNREKVSAAETAGRLRVLLKSEVKEITTESVAVEHDGQLLALRNDAVIVSAGGVLPTGMLKELGIAVETKHGVA